MRPDTRIIDAAPRTDLGGVEVPVLTADVLVVGTGSAGYCAADRLVREGCGEVVVLADQIGAGASRNAGSDKQTYYKLTLAGDGPDSVEEMARTLFEGGAMDGDVALVEAALSARCFYNLVEAGVEFPHDRYGQFVGYKTDHDPRQRATSVGPYTSRSMVEHLERRVLDHGVPVVGGVRVVDLVVDRGGDEPRCVGVLGLRRDVKDDECPLVLVRAADVVLATGGPAGMFADSVWPHGQWGATGAALRAGAVGHNLPEFQFGLSSLRPRWNVSGTYMQAIPRLVSVDEDGVEREFLDEAIGDPGVVASLVFRKGYQWPFDIDKAAEGSSLVDLLTYRETVLRRRRVHLDFIRNPSGYAPDLLDDEARAYLEAAGALDQPDSTPIERLRHMNEPAYRFYLERNPGIDLAREPLEVGVCAQHNNGGIDVDCWWRSSLPGLHPVGEAAGAHGVARPGGAALNSAQVGATRAATWIGAHPCPPVDDEHWLAAAEPLVRQAAGLLARARERFDGDNDTTDEMLHRCTRAMSDRAGLVRSREGLVSLLDDITAWQAEHCEHAAVDPASRRSTDRLFLVRDILTAQQVYVAAMLDHLDHGVGSRGSVLYTDPGGIMPTAWWAGGEELDMEPLFRHRLDSRAHHGQTQRAVLEGGTTSFRWDEVRPIPREDEVFETVWRSYREDGNVH